MSGLFRTCVLGILLCFTAGCASDGSFSNPFSSSNDSSSSDGYQETQESTPYYFGEFPDIPIPNDMHETSGDTFITFGQTGGKSGIQRFSGRMDMVALMNAMRRNMSGHGWNLRSLLRSKKSVLVFEKDTRVCTLIFSDGLINTSMQIFVSPRLDGDTGADVAATTQVGFQHQVQTLLPAQANSQNNGHGTSLFFF